MSDVMTYRRQLLLDLQNRNFTLASSGSYNNSYPVDKAFNGTNLNGNDCWISNNSGERYMKVVLNQDTSINGLTFTSRNDPTSYASDWEVYVSSNDITYTKIMSFSSPTEANKKQEILFERHKCKYIKMVPLSSTAAVGELNFYECFEYYLIKQNGKYYSYNPAQYDTTNKVFKEVSLTVIKDNITSDVNKVLSEKYWLTQTMTIAGEQFKPLDKFTGKFQLVSVKNLMTQINAIKTRKQLIVSKTDISTKIIDKINGMKSTFDTDNNDHIKFAVSNDIGNTWRTSSDNGVTWNTIIDSTIKLDTVNNSNWNNALSIIQSNGMKISDIANIDFNPLMKDGVTLRFAYVICIDNIDSKTVLNTISWDVDNSGYLKQLDNSDVEVDLYKDRVILKPKADFDRLQINVGTGGSITVNQTTGGSNIEEASNDEIVNIVSEVWL